MKQPEKPTNETPQPKMDDVLRRMLASPAAPHVKKKPAPGKSAQAKPAK